MDVILRIREYLQFKCGRKTLDHKIGLLRMKAVAGNLTQEDRDFLQEVASSPRFVDNPKFAQYRPSSPKHRVRVNNVVHPDPAEIDVSQFIARIEPTQHKDTYFPRSSDFISMTQASAGLMRDRLSALSCFDNECAGPVTKQELEKMREEANDPPEVSRSGLTG